MKKPTNHKAIIISAVLTALILAGTGAVVFSSSRPAAGGVAQGGTAAPVVLPTQPPADPANQQAINADQSGTTSASQDATIAAYKAQLDQAYQALNQAYDQINALQAAQAQPASGSATRQEHEGREHGGSLVSGNGEHNDD